LSIFVLPNVRVINVQFTDCLLGSRVANGLVKPYFGSALELLYRNWR
jgi:hypothetical protein